MNCVTFYLNHTVCRQDRSYSLSFSPPQHNVESRADDVHTALHTTICGTIKTQSSHEGQTYAH